MKKIIICLLFGLVAFASIGCGGIHITFDSNDKSSQAEVKQDQNSEKKSQTADDKQSQNTEDKPTVSVNINGVPPIQEKPDTVIIREQVPVYLPNVPSGGFIFPNSNRDYLTQSQISSLTNNQLGIARNEIYARYGYIFSTKQYIEYFKAQSWYTPITKNVTLNSIENYNVDLLKAEENRRGIK